MTNERDRILERIKTMKEKEPDVVMYPKDFKPEGIISSPEPTLREILASILTQVPSAAARDVFSAALGCAIEIAKQEIRNELAKPSLQDLGPQMGAKT